YFENDRCLNCGTELGFDPHEYVMVDVGRRDEAGGWTHPLCANAASDGCNWVVPTGEDGALCRSCALTRTRPPGGDPEAHARFVEAEQAKRRLVVQLIDLGLPLVGFDVRDEGLGFDLLSSRFEEVVTGHEAGLITIDLAEADDAHRERV